MSYRCRQPADDSLADRLSKTERLAAVGSIRFGPASNGSFLLATLRGEEISVRVSAARGKIPAPHLAGSGVNDKSVIPCACNLVTADRFRRSRTCNTERDENPNSQTKQCTLMSIFVFINGLM